MSRQRPIDQRQTGALPVPAALEGADHCKGNRHPPILDRAALVKLRSLARSINERQAAAIPLQQLITLAETAPENVGVTIDFDATKELGEPLLVVRVPERDGAASHALANLTTREREIARLVARGLANKQVAAKLGIATATVKDHVHNILEKTGFRNRAAIAAAVVGSRS